MKKLFLILCAIILSGCQLGGPYVRNVHYNEEGILTYEECTLQSHYLFGKGLNADCVTHMIRLLDKNQFP